MLADKTSGSPMTRYLIVSEHGVVARSPRFHPLFNVDVLSSADWYECKTVRLGVDFTHRIESDIEELLSDPERRSNIHFGFRYWPIKRFPHLILYDVTVAEKLIFSVMQPSQEPDQWGARRG
jgi:hypothetical protein